MSQHKKPEFIPVDISSPEEGDLLPDSVRIFHSDERLTELEVTLCDGEGGGAPSKGTKSD